ncbi:MAG: elongation factor P [Thermodesulfovibrionales bacterium]|nr:elongation factor P [Thermodesulfovibrionales bacterium]
MIATSDFRRGAKIEYKGEPCEIVEFQHVKMGRGGAIVRTKLKSLITGSVLEDTFRSGEKFESPQLEEKQMQHLYEQDDLYYFMDTESYEQVSLDEKHIGDSRQYLKENTVVSILYYKERPIAVALPTFVELMVKETEPGFKGDTASGGAKPAVLETGASVRVPFHINKGDTVKVDTRTGEYIERVK